jgi:hypothetical protein
VEWLASPFPLSGKQAVMAGQILNRRELRKQADQAEQLEAVAAAPAAVAATPEKKTKARKARAAPKMKKPRKPKAPPRLRARWGVFDGGMKQVAIFDYNQRTAAQEKLADLLVKKKSAHFLQIVKEPMPEPAPALTPSVE